MRTRKMNIASTHIKFSDQKNGLADDVYQKIYFASDYITEGTIKSTKDKNNIRYIFRKENERE